MEIIEVTFCVAKIKHSKIDKILDELDGWNLPNRSRLNLYGSDGEGWNQLSYEHGIDFKSQPDKINAMLKEFGW